MFSSSLCVFLVFFFLGTSASKLVPRRAPKPYILNGDLASSGQFPWQVGITFNGDTSEWYCSGVLIKEDWVLTAGHCGSLMFITAIAYAGSVDDRYGGNSSFTYGIGQPSGYSPHPLSNDIGLLYLEEPFDINDNVKPIDLSWEPLGPNVNITVSGWGATNDDEGAGPSGSLSYITLSTIDNSECKNTYGEDTIGDEMFCAVSTGNVPQATCFGDNGGPAIIYKDGNLLLVGIASFVSNRGCESGDPSGFTRIANFADWIKSTAGL